MSFTKFATAEVMDVRSAPVRIESPTLAKYTSNEGDFSDFNTEDGYVYVRVRAISSRVNRNNDGWPSEELAKSYRTFLGKPIYVDHHNHDPGRARGVVVDAKLHVDDDMDKVAKLDPYYASAPGEHLPPTWIELLLETDAKAFPKLAKAIADGDIDAVSMGANVEKSKCSNCGNWASSPEDYCVHVREKGAEHSWRNPKTGSLESKVSYEDCYDIGFFEISYVFDPADETALFMERIGAIIKEGSVKPQWDEGLEAVLAADDQRINSYKCKDCGTRFTATADEAECPKCHSDVLEVTDDSKESRRTAEYKYVKQQGDKWVITQKGTGKVLSEHDSEEKAKSAFRAMEMNMHGGSKTADTRDLPQADMTIAPEKVDTLRQETVCPVCFVPGTMVRTREGYVPIETVEPGDEVLTESGLFNRVSSLIETEYNGMLYRINSGLFSEPVLTTPNHPFKTLMGNHPKKSKEDRCRPGVCDKSLGFENAHSLVWSCAEHLTGNSWIVGQTVTDTQDRDSVDIPEQFRGKRARKGPVSFDLTPDFLWMLGMYIAEGNSGKRDITFSLHRNETDFQDRLRAIFEGLGYATRLTFRDGRDGAWLTVSASTLAEWFPAWLGEGCAHKRIPSEILNLANEKLRYVIQGIFDGDGVKKVGSVRQTSRDLALQLSEWAVRNGRISSTGTENTEDKRTVYRVENVVAVKERVQKYARNTWMLEGKPLARITSVDQVPYWGSVFNLSVEEDHTYVVAGALVHNCGSEMEDGVCEVCNFEEPPEGFGNPDLTKAEDLDDKQEQQGMEAEDAQQQSMDQTEAQGMQPGGPQGQPGPTPAGMPMAASFTFSGSNSQIANTSAGFTATCTTGTTANVTYIPRPGGDVSIEKTAADLQGGRVNTQEKPILPVSRQNSDRPKEQKTISDSRKPVESNNHKEHHHMTDTKKTADGARPNGGADVQPATRVDPDGKGGIGLDPESGIKTVDPLGVGGVDSVTFDSIELDAPVADAIGPHTDTWHGGEGDSAGQQKAVTENEPVLGAKTVKGWPDGLATDGFESVDLDAPLAEEVGDPTKTFGEDSFHITDPVTNEKFEGDEGIKDEASAGPDHSPFPSEEEAVKAARVQWTAALKVAETEVAMGITSPDEKLNRLADLEDEGIEALNTRLETMSRVKTAAAKRTARTATTKTGGVPSLKPESAFARREASNSDSQVDIAESIFA